MADSKKYFVEFDYVLDEDQTIKYDKNARVFANYLRNGITTVASNLDELKSMLVEILTKGSEEYEFDDVLGDTSFNVKITELGGLNKIIKAIITTEFARDENEVVYEGLLDNFGK